MKFKEINDEIDEFNCKFVDVVSPTSYLFLIIIVIISILLFLISVILEVAGR